MATLFCVVVLEFMGPSAFAEEPALAPQVASPDQAAAPDSAAVPDSLYRIYPTKGPWIDARRVEPWSLNSIRYRTPSGQIGYLDNSKIRSITDVDGDERLEEVLVGRKALGNQAAGESRSVDSWLVEPLRSTPDRRRPSFVIAEVGYAVHVGGDSETSQSPTGSMVSTGLGWMKNLSPRWGLGAVLQFESDLEDYRSVGIGARFRRYFGDSWSVEGTAGVFAADYGSNTTSGGTPVFVDVGATVLGELTLFTHFEHHEYEYERITGIFGPVTLEGVEVSEDFVSAGLRVGPRPRYLLIPAAVLGAVLILFGNSSTTVY